MNLQQSIYTKFIQKQKLTFLQQSICRKACANKPTNYCIVHFCNSNSVYLITIKSALKSVVDRYLQNTDVQSSATN